MMLPPIYRYEGMMRLRPVFDKQARDTSAGELPKTNEWRAGLACRAALRCAKK
jgi:hypothetical protein